MDFSGGAVDKREKYLNLSADLIRNLQLGPLASQIAFVRYSGPKRTDAVFHLKKHYKPEDAIKEMSQTPSLGGTTRTGEALLQSLQEFQPKFGGRKNAEKIIIVFTDGYSQDDPVDASTAIFKQNIQIYSVAVTDTILPPDLEQLKSIASDSKSVFFDKDFPKLIQILKQSNCF